MAETADMAVRDRPREGRRRRAARPSGRSRRGYHEGADLAAARAALQRALLRIRVAERRHREGPRHARLDTTDG